MNAGDLISDYIVERVLGEGGMGTVYLAHHSVLDQQVAIKILDPEIARKPGVKERFIQEANIQAKLKHPNVVQVLTATKTGGDTPALIMEYIDGKSLSEVLELRGALPIDDALKIMEQVLSAVGYAHRQGVIHRDLKPSNVMVMASGEAKVTDFGIAKVLGSTKLTRTGTAMGSAHYMSPEQIRRPETVDVRSDIYSLGCVFYEVLTGRPPFGEKDASGTESDYEVKTAHVTEVAPALETVVSGIPAWLAKLVMSMLEKELDQRSSSCEAILEKLKAGDGLERVRGEKTTGTTDPGQIEHEHDQKNSQKKAAAAKEKQVATEFNRGTLLIIFLIVLGASVIFIQEDKKSPEQQDSGQIENSSAPTEQAPNTIADQAAPLVQKIEGGNPNNLAPCPRDQNARFHNCWGTYTLANGNKLVGEWKNDKIHGQGANTKADGNNYVGEFKDGQKHGQGTYTWPSGQVYVGEWKSDKFEGRGIIYLADGTIVESGIYENDRLVRSEYVDPNSFTRIAR